MSKWMQHKQNWLNCSKCALCETRTNVVLFRGKIPCDILLVGEAPGRTEDLFGKPFVGPSGHLLHDIVEKAGLTKYRLGFTNVVACIPVDSEGSKVSEPKKAHVKVCRDRLLELLKMCKPTYLVGVGKIADRYLDMKDGFEYTTITHPGNILRMDITQRGLQFQRAVIALRDLVEE